MLADSRNRRSTAWQHAHPPHRDPPPRPPVDRPLPRARRSARLSGRRRRLTAWIRLRSTGLRRVLLGRRPPPWWGWRTGRGPGMGRVWHQTRPQRGWRQALVRRTRYRWRSLSASTVRPRLVDPVQHKIGCPRGRHRDAQVLADGLVGSQLGDDDPALALCERCGNAVAWPNGQLQLGPAAPTRPGSQPP
jgi:hypothetical protein